MNIFTSTRRPPTLGGRFLVISSLVVSTAFMASVGHLTLHGAGGLGGWGAALAQDITVSSDEIMNYAASVLQMEGPRTQAYNEIRALLEGTSIDINSVSLRCTTTHSLNQLPRRIRNDVRTLVVNYCNQASRIVQANGLRNDRFDDITAAYPQDSTLAEQIRAALMQLQQRSQTNPSSNN